MSDNIDCFICYETINQKTGKVVTPCQHVYCVSCFSKHMRTSNKCGYCRREIAPELNNIPPEMVYTISHYSVYAAGRHDLWFELLHELERRNEADLSST